MWHILMAVLIFLGGTFLFSAALLLLMHFGPSFNQASKRNPARVVFKQRPPTT